MSYLDSMVKNDEFLTHLGNAMRGSLLAGKAYPSAGPAAPGPAQEPPADDRLDRVLFALHQVQGQLNDLRMTIDELRTGAKGPPPTMSATPPARKRAPAKPARKTARRKTGTAKARR
jgi:hypothetical protein